MEEKYAKLSNLIKKCIDPNLTEKSLIDFLDLNGACMTFKSGGTGDISRKIHRDLTDELNQFIHLKTNISKKPEDIDMFVRNSRNRLHDNLMRQLKINADLKPEADFKFENVVEYLIEDVFDIIIKEMKEIDTIIVTHKNSDKHLVRNR